MAFQFDAGKHFHGIKAEWTHTFISERKDQHIVLKSGKHLKRPILCFGRLKNNKGDLLSFFRIPQLIQNIEHSRGLSASGDADDQPVFGQLLTRKSRCGVVDFRLVLIVPKIDRTDLFTDPARASKTCVVTKSRKSRLHRRRNAPEIRQFFHKVESAESLRPKRRLLAAVRKPVLRGNNGNIHILIKRRQQIEDLAASLIRNDLSLISHRIGDKGVGKFLRTAVCKHADRCKVKMSKVKLLVHLLHVVQRRSEYRELLSLPKDFAVLISECFAVHALPEYVDAVIEPASFLFQIFGGNGRHFDCGASFVPHKGQADAFHRIGRRCPGIRDIKGLMKTARIIVPLIGLLILDDLRGFTGPGKIRAFIEIIVRFLERVLRSDECVLNLMIRTA